MKVRSFFNETFGFEVHLVVNCNLDQFQDYVRRTSKPKYKNPGKFHAICHTVDNYVIIGLTQWTGSAHDIGTLAHEIEHGVFYSMKRRGIKHNRQTDEVFAYLQDSLLRRSLQALGVK